MTLDRARLEKTLRSFMAADVDYDLHKSYERDEETGEDTYPDLVDAFLGHWDDAEEPVTIDAESAAHVLFQERRGGWPPSTFPTKLLDAWTSADTPNAARLAVAFPAYGAAIELVRSGHEGIEKLSNITGETT